MHTVFTAGLHVSLSYLLISLTFFLNVMGARTFANMAQVFWGWMLFLLPN